jgi:hypothetical protein
VYIQFWALSYLSLIWVVHKVIDIVMRVERSRAFTVVPTEAGFVVQEYTEVS